MTILSCFRYHRRRRALQRRVVGVPQRLLEAHAFGENGDLLGRAGQCGRRKRRQRRVAVTIALAAPAALADRRIQVAYAGLVIASPAQPARPRRGRAPTVATFHQCTWRYFIIREDMNCRTKEKFTPRLPVAAPVPDAPRPGATGASRRAACRRTSRGRIDSPPARRARRRPRRTTDERN